MNNFSLGVAGRLTDFDIDTGYKEIRLPTAGYNDFDFKTTPSVPCTRDNLLTAIHSSGRFCIFDRKFSTDHVGTAEAIYNTVKAAEWFDFGKFDSEDMARCGRDALPFLKENMLRAPYERCVFRCRVTGGGNSAQFELLLMIHDMVRAPGLFDTTILCMRTNGARNEYVSLMSGVLVANGEVHVIGDNVVKDGSLIALYEYAAMWSILNTRGVSKEVIEPDARLNRARIKANKPPLQRVFRIDSKRYITALRETERMESAGERTGDRRSPRMHLRRGHMRKFSSERFVGLKGKTRWIRPMIVGGDTDQIVNRERYEVRK